VRVSLLLVLGEQGLVITGAEHVGDVEERRLLGADVDERRLHARKHTDDASLVDVADDPALALPLEIKLAELTVVDQRDTRLRSVGVDDQ
jgi:hypothetical protein